MCFRIKWGKNKNKLLTDRILMSDFTFRFTYGQLEIEKIA